MLDFNGTIAVDGIINTSIKRQIINLSEFLAVYVLTADTHGTAAIQCHDLPVTLKTFPSSDAGKEKLRILTDLGSEQCVCIGNGNNDIKMLTVAALSMSVIDKEGASAKLVGVSDLVFTSSTDALDSLLNTQRIIAGLRG